MSEGQQVECPLGDAKRSRSVAPRYLRLAGGGARPSAMSKWRSLGGGPGEEEEEEEEESVAILAQGGMWTHGGPPFLVGLRP